MDCLLVLLALVLRLGMAGDLSTRILVAQKFKHVGHITIIPIKSNTTNQCQSNAF